MIRSLRVRWLLVVVSCSLVGCMQVAPAKLSADDDAVMSEQRWGDSSSEARASSQQPGISGGSATGVAGSGSSAGTSFGSLATIRRSEGASARSAGSDVLTTNVFYGVPILQKSFFWDGNGEVDNSGLGVHWLHYLADGVALGPGLNATTWWTPGRDVYSAELQALLRIHPIESLPVFLDGSAGYQLANDQIPPGGTVWNFTFGFGLGAEVPVAERTWFQAGAMYHHISNALGRQNDRNPSQNEVRFWVGLAFDL